MRKVKKASVKREWHCEICSASGNNGGKSAHQKTHGVKPKAKGRPRGPLKLVEKSSGALVEHAKVEAVRLRMLEKQGKRGLFANWHKAPWSREPGPCQTPSS